MEVVKEIPKGAKQDREFRNIYSDEIDVYTEVLEKADGKWVFEYRKFTEFGMAKKHLKERLTKYFTKKHKKLPTSIKKHLEFIYGK